MTRTPTLVGSIVGIITFIATALSASLAYGGYAGLLLANGTVGVENFIGRAIIVLCMSLGVIGVCSLFAVIGAMVGTAVGSVVSFGKLASASK